MFPAVKVVLCLRCSVLFVFSGIWVLYLTAVSTEDNSRTRGRVRRSRHRKGPLEYKISMTPGSHGHPVLPCSSLL